MENVDKKETKKFPCLNDDKVFVVLKNCGNKDIVVSDRTDTETINNSVSVRPERSYEELFENLNIEYPEHQAGVLEFFHVHYWNNDIDITILDCPKSYSEDLDTIIDLCIKYKKICVSNIHNIDVGYHTKQDFGYGYESIVIFDNVFVLEGYLFKYCPNAKEKYTKKQENKKKNHLVSVAFPASSLDTLFYDIFKAYFKQKFPYLEKIKLASTWDWKPNKYQKVKGILDVSKKLKDYKVNNALILKHMEYYYDTMLSYKPKKSKDEKLNKIEIQYKELLPKLKKFFKKQMELTDDKS